MNEVLQFISDFWGLFFGGSGIIMAVLFFRQTKSIKMSEAKLRRVEADSAEIEACRKSIEILQQRVDDLYKELKETRQELLNVRAENSTLHQDKSRLEMKNSLKKSMINCAPGCHNIPPEGCPVLNKQKEVEEAYLKSLQKTQ